MDSVDKLCILVPVTQCRSQGYPQPSQGSIKAFEWILRNIVRADISGYSMQFLHVKDPKATREEYESGRELLQYFMNRCHDIGVHAHSWIVLGVDVKTEICNEADKIKPHAVVMPSSTNGFFGFLNWVLNWIRGVTTIPDYCKKNTECQVHVI